MMSDEVQRNDKSQMTKLRVRANFGIRHLIIHSSFLIRASSFCDAQA